MYRLKGGARRVHLRTLLWCPAILVCAVALQAQNPRRPVPAQPGATEWTLTFSDEFDGPLDLAKWIPHDPWGTQRPRELHGYVNDAAHVSAGQLHLEASRVPTRYDGRERDFQSGVVSTFGTFSQAFGRFEIRCRIPAGSGLAPSFRLFPVPLAALPEIDVLLGAGNEPSKIRFANHWGSEQTTRSFFDAYAAPDLSAGFHTVAIEWDKNAITWFVDGKETMRSTEGVPQQAMFLVLDLAVGGTLAGAPDERTRFPAAFDVDYIRVYQHR